MKNFLTNGKPQNILVLSCQEPKMQCLGLTPFYSLMTEIPIIEKPAYWFASYRNQSIDLLCKSIGFCMMQGASVIKELKQ